MSTHYKLVKHILDESIEFTDVRYEYSVASSMKELFENVDVPVRIFIISYEIVMLMALISRGIKR